MRKNSQIERIVNAGFLMLLGLLLFKWSPMVLWGDNILSDASAHIIAATFLLYLAWFFIDQNHNWHIPFFIFAALFLFVISVQRIIADAHNDVGLLLGFTIATFSIAIAEKENLKGKIRF